MIKDNDIHFLSSIGIDVFKKDRKYWFIRTQSGMYYDDFTKENFVGIEWDEISDLNFIKTASDDEWRIKILENYKDVEKPGSIINQIKKFVNEIKAGDIVLIPNYKSRWLAIGEILNDDIEIFKEDTDFESILYSLDDNEIKEHKTIIKKRRKVKWLKEVKRSDWDPYLEPIIHSNSAILDADKYALYIDRMLSQFYIKGDEAFLTYKVNKKSNIPYRDMLNFLNNNDKLIALFSSNCPNLDLDINDVILKINVQSKGPIQFKGTFKTILISGIIIGGLFGTNFSFNFLGQEFNIETEGLPALIRAITESVVALKNSEKNEELEAIINALNIDKDKLEIDFPQLKLPSDMTTESEISSDEEVIDNNEVDNSSSQYDGK